MIALNRRRVMGGESLPYDAQVEYLESSGTQYIDTGYIGNSQTTTFEMLFIVKSLDDGRSLMGSRVTSNTRFCWVMQPYNATQVGYGASYNNISINLQADDVVKISTAINNGTITYTIEDITRGTTGSKSYTVSSFSTTNVLLFYSGVLNKARVKMKSLSFFENGVKTMDLIPVRIDTTGYMYDKVSGNLFGNAGTGSFTYGNDV